MPRISSGAQSFGHYLLGLPDTTRGVLAGLMSAVLVAAYIVTNKHIYDTFQIGAVEYSLLFAIIGGTFGFCSLLYQLRRGRQRSLQSDSRRFMVLGVAGFIAVGLLVTGQQFTTSVNAALLATGSVLTTMLFSWLLLREPPSRRQLVWLAGLFAGLYIGIVGLHSLHVNRGDVIVVASIFFFGFGNVYSRKVMRDHGSTIVPDVRLAIGGGIALLASIFAFHAYSILPRLLPWAVLAGTFYWLCMRTFAASVHLINANQAIVINNSQIFFTSIASVLILGEHYSLEKFAGSLLALTSIYFITKPRKAANKQR